MNKFPARTIPIEQLLDLDRGGIDLRALEKSEGGEVFDERAATFAERPATALLALTTTARELRRNRQAKRSKRIESVAELRLDDRWRPLQLEPRTKPDRVVGLSVASQPAYGLEGGTGWMSNYIRESGIEETGRREITLSALVGRSMSVATLKEAFGCPRETVLKKNGDRWEPLPDSHLIDLTDQQAQYLIGQITVYS